MLDAVLLFQYKFRFKVDYVVATRASRGKRIARIMRRDGVSRGEALARIERQRKLESEWAKADVSIATDRKLADVRAEAGRIRDRFLARADDDGKEGTMQEKLTHREIEERVLDMERQLSGLRGCL